MIINNENIEQLPGHWANYGISECGVVYNLTTHHQISMYIANIGYASYRLWSCLTNGYSSIVCMHRLLALAYIPNGTGLPYDKLDVNHLDGNKLNNCLSNLEWATRSRNCQHAYDTGLRNDNKLVTIIDMNTNVHHNFNSLHACARKLGVTPGAISHHLKYDGILANTFKVRYSL